MTDQTPTRRELMKPVQLLGFAFAAAVFAGIITLVSMGVFQEPRVVPAGELHPHLKAWIVAGVVAGIAFIVTLVTIALLMLAVDPAQMTRQVDRPVLFGSDEGVGAEGPAADGEVAGDESPPAPH